MLIIIEAGWWIQGSWLHYSLYFFIFEKFYNKKLCYKISKNVFSSSQMDVYMHNVFTIKNILRNCNKNFVTDPNV